MNKTLICLLLVMLGFVLLGGTQAFAEDDPDGGTYELSPSGLQSCFDIGTVNLTEEDPEPAEPQPSE